MTLDPEQVLKRAEEDTLSAQDVAELVRALEGGNGAHMYTYLHALGHARATWAEDVVAGYLGRRDDPFLVRMALQVLCSFWGLASKYKPQVIEFAKGVDWDVEAGGYVRLAALSEAGALARVDGDPALTELLASIAAAADETTVTRDAAYDALLLATQKDMQHLPPASRLRGPHTYDWGLLRSVMRSDRSE